MATASVLTKEPTATSQSTTPCLEITTDQAASLVQRHLHQLVERASTLLDVPVVTLAVLDPLSQRLRGAAIACTHGQAPPSTHLRVHQALARWVTRHRVRLLIGDAASDSRVRSLGLRASGSWLSVPLLVGQEVVGALTLASPVLNAFGPLHLEVLNLVADLGALAIFQARHLAAGTQQGRQQSILLEVARELTIASDGRALVRHTMSALRQLIPCEEAVLFRYQAQTETLCGVAGLGTHSSRLADAHIRVRDPQSVTAWVAQQRRPILHAGGTAGFIGQATEALLAHRKMALLAVPLVAGEQLLGVILLARARPFAPADLRTLLTLGQLLAPALARAGSSR
jgi:GAF domain-containing protein